MSAVKCEKKTPFYSGLSGRFEICPSVTGICGLAAMLLRLKRYMYIKNAERTESVYSLLGFVPVESRAIFAARAGYAAEFSLKCGGVFLVLQHSGALLQGTWNIWNVIYPAAAAAEMLAAGLLYALPWGKLGGRVRCILYKFFG